LSWRISSCKTIERGEIRLLNIDRLLHMLA
jgi:hypothetical protein